MKRKMKQKTKIKYLLESKHQLEEEYYDINEELDVFLQMGSTRQNIYQYAKTDSGSHCKRYRLDNKRDSGFILEKMNLTTKIGERNKRTFSKTGRPVQTKRTLENEAINNI